MWDTETISHYSISYVVVHHHSNYQCIRICQRLFNCARNIQKKKGNHKVVLTSFLWIPPCIKDNLSMCLQQKSIKSTASVYAALTCDGILATMALLGHISLVAVHAVNLVVMGSEASSCQRFMAGVTHKTLRVPGLILIADSSSGDGLRGTERQFDHDFNRAGRSFILLKWANVILYVYVFLGKLYLSKQEQTDEFFSQIYIMF